jgi:chloramphenicol 3-O-phosphotransferase
VDDFVSELFVEQQKNPLSEKEFLARVFAACDFMYAKIRVLVGQGKNVILDTVLTGLEGEKSVRDTLAKLEGMQRYMVLVY